MRWPLACAITLITAPATAAVQLTWEAPPACPSQATIESRISSLLETSTETTPVSAEARITRVDDRYRLDLTTSRSGTRGERTLEDSSCAALAESAALIVAMTVDPIAVVDDPIPAPSPSPAPPPPAIVPSPPVVEHIEPARVSPPRAHSFILSAGAGMHAGAFPRPAVAVQLGLGLELARVRLDAIARWSPRARHPLETPAGAGAAFDLLVAQVRAAHLFSGWMGPAVALEVGRAAAAGYGVSTPLSGSAPWYAVSAGVLGSVRRGDVGLGAELMAVIPLGRPDFVVENAGVAHTPAAIGLRASLTGEVRF